MTLRRGHALDYEIRPLYDDITIAVMDGVHVSYAKVAVSVVNVNDNIPQCLQVGLE